jgi:hypothetical protein
LPRDGACLIRAMSELKRSVESPEAAIARIVGHADIP